MKNKQIIAPTIVALLLMSGGLYYFSLSAEQRTDLLENPTENVSADIRSRIPADPDLPENIADVVDEPPEGYIKYENKKYGFYFYHSPQSKITEYDEGGGAMTITQENEQKMRGLQIFIVPYYEDTISEERFKRDVPSGVRYNIEETRIGKIQIPAVTFNSYDEFLGDTREVWFIHDDHLYEITTFKGLADWFGPIMQTWRFIKS